MQDHGGNIDSAMQRWGGGPADWVDLSTGINRVPYPVPVLPAEAWTALPTRTAMARLAAAARAAYRTDAPLTALAGAQAAIQLVPRLDPPGRAKVLGPTYNEHAAALGAAGWHVEEVTQLSALAGADLAVVVNPNNPDGRVLTPAELLGTCGSVGRLIVDESFADPTPGLSVADRAGTGGMIVLRSFGKFFGLAGVRLGFALGAEADIARLAAMAGPWPVSGAAIGIGCAALADGDWSQRTIARLGSDAAGLDRLATGAGWRLAGGTALFRLYEADTAAGAQIRLAEHRVWSRIFPYSDRWIRLGLPGSEADWAQVARALA